MNGRNSVDAEHGARNNGRCSLLLEVLLGTFAALSGVVDPAARSGGAEYRVGRVCLDATGADFLASTRVANLCALEGNESAPGH